MTRVSTAAAVASTVYAATLLVNQAQGHSYMKYPPSRQGLSGEGCPHCYNARGPQATVERARQFTDPQVLQDYGGGSVYPLTHGDFAENGNYLETDEIGVRHGFCGDPEQNAAEGTNSYSTPNINWSVPEGSVFKSGGIIEIDTVYNAWHWGHMGFFLCDTQSMDDPDGLPTSGCFAKYPLTRTYGGSGSPIDPNYPGRYYVDPPSRFFELDDGNNPINGYNVKARYILPAIVTEHAILQMVYYTGNSCKHPGYDDFNPPDGSWPGNCSSKRGDWIIRDVEPCGESQSYPEEFWGCSDIAITADGLSLEEVGPPALNPLGGPDDGSETSNWEDAGCFAGTSNLEAWVVQGPWMSHRVCFLSCVSQGAYWMGLVNGDTCYCHFDPNLDSPGEGTCDIPCTGTGSETCGGSDSTTVLRITASDCTADMLEEGGGGQEEEEEEEVTLTTEETVSTSQEEEEEDEEEGGEGQCTPLDEYEQCGGDGYTGSTCCAEGLECQQRGMGTCYFACRTPDKQVCVDAVPQYEQCGGDGYEGSMCCDEGLECTVLAPCYHQCRPGSGDSGKSEESGGESGGGAY